MIVRPSRPSLPQRSAIARARARRRERGAALFLVVLVATLLVAVGLFSARSAVLATTSSGHIRQSTQARYLMEYALVAATEIARVKADACWDRAMNSAEAAKLKCPGQSMSTLPRCYRVTWDEVKEDLAGQSLTPLKADSLGDASIGGTFQVDLTDWSTSGGTPLPGFDQRFKFYNVTATAWGRVARGALASDEYSQSNAAARGYVLVGPTLR